MSAKAVVAVPALRASVSLLPVVVWLAALVAAVRAAFNQYVAVTRLIGLLGIVGGTIAVLTGVLIGVL
jgi:hypothetical protein